MCFVCYFSAEAALPTSSHANNHAPQELAASLQGTGQVAASSSVNARVTPQPRCVDCSLAHHAGFISSVFQLCAVTFALLFT